MTRIGILLITFIVTLGAFAHGPGLSLRIADEKAPAGSVVQIKIEVTEPKPISTGRGKIKVRGITAVEGIVLMNEGQDTYGVAMVDGNELTFAVTSPSSVFGTPADYPILGIAGTVDSSAAVGTSFPLTLDTAGLTFRDASGAVYPYEIANGNLTVSNGVTIGDVEPGSAIVPAGGVVRITGTNFKPSTRLQLNETSIREQRFVSSNRIDVVLGQTASMHGMRIRARNDDGDDRSESEYFSYERTTAIGASNDAILSKTVPLFAPAKYTSAIVDLPRRSNGRRRAVGHSLTWITTPSTPKAALGFGLQNLESSTATVEIELLNSAGHPYAVNTLSIAPNQSIVREVSEVFGIVATPSAYRIRSNAPIQILGLVTDPGTGTAAALPPR